MTFPGQLRETKATPCTNLEFVEAVCRAVKSITGEPPSKEATLLVTAKSILECGHGWKSLWGWNIGNIKQMPGSSHPDYQMLRNVFEYEGGRKVVYQPPHPQTWFRWYPSLAAGLEDYLRLLLKNRKFAPAWESLLRGDGRGYVYHLHAAGYFSAAPDVYWGSVGAIYRQLMASDVYETARGWLDLHEM